MTAAFSKSTVERNALSHVSKLYEMRVMVLLSDGALFHERVSIIPSFIKLPVKTMLNFNAYTIV